MFTQEELDEKFKGGEIKVFMVGGRIYDGIVSRCLFNEHDDGAMRLSIEIEYMVTYQHGAMRPSPDYRSHLIRLEYSVTEPLFFGELAFSSLELTGEVAILRPKWLTRLDHDAIRRLHAAAAAAA